MSVCASSWHLWLFRKSLLITNLKFNVIQFFVFLFIVSSHMCAPFWDEGPCLSCSSLYFKGRSCLNPLCVAEIVVKRMNVKSENECRMKMDVCTQQLDGVNWGSGIDVCALPCVKQVASENLLCITGSSAWWWPRWMGWGGLGAKSKREATHVSLQLIHLAEE